MSRSGLRFGVRALLVVLLWTAGALFCARSVEASGCHASERPVLGLTSLTDGLLVTSTALDRAPSRFSSLPCREELPGRTYRASSPMNFVPAEAATLTPASNGGPRVVPEDPRTPSRFPERLDRPPR